MECRKAEDKKQRSLNKQAAALCLLSAANHLLPTECKED